jgi:hypothetical protein
MGLVGSSLQVVLFRWELILVKSHLGPPPTPSTIEGGGMGWGFDPKPKKTKCPITLGIRVQLLYL